MELSVFIGETFEDVRVVEDELIFRRKDGTSLKLYHEQDCCESVQIEDINGSLSDLEKTPILKADETTNSEEHPNGFNTSSNYIDDSFTWTFYTFATIKGYVTVRWLGTSNGYYGEGVDLWCSRDKKRIE